MTAAGTAGTPTGDLAPSPAVAAPPVPVAAAAPAAAPPAFPGVPQFGGAADASDPTQAGPDIRLDPQACSIEAMRNGGECEACQ